jgi:hypothetical protein
MLAACAVSALAGCPDPAPPEEVAPIAAPVIPWLEAGEPPIAEPVIPWASGVEGDPVTRACATGWHARTTEAGVICDPWPEGGRVVCDGATAMRPGELTCQPIGRPCPGSGEFPDDVPAGAIFVRAGAAGTGTRLDPVGTLAEAAARAVAGQTIVLASGELDARTTFSVPVSLRGACVERTHLIGPLVLDAATSLEDVTVSSEREGIVSRGGLSARGVLVTSHVGNGIDLRGTDHTLEDVVVRGGGGSTSGWTAGVHVINGSVTATRLVVEGRAGFALLVDGRATATITDSVFADGRPFEASPTALVLVRDVAMGASFTRTVFENGVHELLMANGGTVTLEDVLAQGARIQEGEPVAFGIIAYGAAVTARGVRTHDIDGFGLSVAAGRVEVEDYVADGTHADSVGLHAEERGTLVARRARLGPIGIGARAFLRGSLELEDAAIEGARLYSLNAAGEEAVATFRRVVAHDGAAGLRTSMNATTVIEDAVFEDLAGTGVGDDAIGAYLRSRVTAHRIRATRCANSCYAALQSAEFEISDARCSGAELGVVAALEGHLSAHHMTVEDIEIVALLSEEGASIDLTDVAVRGVGPTEDISSGFWANDRSSGTLSRVTFRDVQGWGVSCGATTDPPVVTVEDAVIEDATLGGLTPDCTMTLRRLEVLRPGVAGLTNALAVDVTLEDVRIVDVQPDPVDGRFGHGVHLVGAGVLRGRGLAIEGAHGGGLVAVGAMASVDLTDVWVSGVRSAPCGEGCIGGGSGIVATEGARVRLVNVRSFGHEVAGVQVMSPASVSLEGGSIHDNAIGRNLSPELDNAPLLGVTYLANGVEEDRRALPLPASTLF